MEGTETPVLTGKHFINGDAACAEGAIAAGCRFFAGYPITPSTEIAERLASRLPEVGGHYIQMEDELGSMAAVLGASWTGLRAMTATSGPGFTLMMENIGWGAITETPCVVVNIQRGGPSTGLPTLVAQADVMQAKWGSHGDYEIIAYAPATCQEMFDFTIKAFNAADRYRTPVFVLSDEVVGHTTEKVVIPDPWTIPRVKVKRPAVAPGNGFLPFLAEDDLVPPMPRAGDGYLIHVTGLTHDERGYPVTTEEAHHRLVERISRKISSHASEIVEYDEVMLEDAQVVVLAYGSTSRAARRAVAAARAEGIRAGLLRLITLWPFPGERVKSLPCAEALVVPELNLGQVARECERYTRLPIFRVNRAGGAIMPPRPILDAIVEAARL